ncbi:glutamine ABC transporter ATP-binding domain protein [Enterobacter hormaechei subsp. xiangfangensis]|nr:glutamine ABC transporter ATP-binding domain protein [Enterobacter hormaechei subsp. xiangfangensis]
MVFQQFYLFPHLTALENVMFGPLRVRGASKAAAEALAKDLLAKVAGGACPHYPPASTRVIVPTKSALPKKWRPV